MITSPCLSIPKGQGHFFGSEGEKHRNPSSGGFLHSIFRRIFASVGPRSSVRFAAVATTILLPSVETEGRCCCQWSEYYRYQHLFGRIDLTTQERAELQNLAARCKWASSSNPNATAPDRAERCADCSWRRRSAVWLTSHYLVFLERILFVLSHSHSKEKKVQEKID